MISKLAVLLVVAGCATSVLAQVRPTDIRAEYQKQYQNSDTSERSLEYLQEVERELPELRALHGVYVYADMLLFLGHAYYAHGRLTAAEDKFQAIVNMEGVPAKAEIDACRMLGQRRMAQPGREREALAWYQRGLDRLEADGLDMTMPLHRYMMVDKLASIEQMIGKHDAAIERRQLLDSLEMGHDAVAQWNNAVRIARMQAKKGQYAEARDSFRRAIALSTADDLREFLDLGHVQDQHVRTIMEVARQGFSPDERESSLAFLLEHLDDDLAESPLYIQVLEAVYKHPDAKRVLGDRYAAIGRQILDRIGMFDRASIQVLGLTNPAQYLQDIDSVHMNAGITLLSSRPNWIDAETKSALRGAILEHASADNPLARDIRTWLLQPQQP